MALVMLDEDFAAPIPRAQLEIFLLLADAIRPSLGELYRVLPEDWHEALTILAKILHQVLPATSKTSQLRLIWNQFLADVRIIKLPKRAARVLQVMTAQVAANSAKRRRSLRYLDEANDQAVHWIRALGASQSLPSLTQIKKVPVRIYFDPRAEQYCASSSPLVGEIGWKLQLIEYALYGALIPDLVFEHEYLSHLLPRNQALSPLVRERWLNVALKSVHQNAGGPLRFVKLYLWDRFRDELSQHRGGERQAFGPHALEATASNAAFFQPEIFWALTECILALDDGEKPAAAMDDTLTRMARLDDNQLRSVLASRWAGLDVFNALLTATNN